MEEIRFSPEDLIFSEHENDDSAIYFITKGEVNIFYENYDYIKGDTIYSTFEENNIFEEISFFTGNKRKASAQITGFTRMFKIKRSDFLELIKSYSNDFEQYCKLRD